jgi:hypothetical protein
MPAPEPKPELRPRIWVGSIVINCTDFGRMLAFWQAALHYVPRNPPKGTWVVLQDPEGKGPNVSLDGSDEPPWKDYRIHLDLYATDPLGEFERLQKLGARVVQAPTAGHDYVTLADPDGNLFDVIDVNWPDDRPDWSFGRKA